MFDEHIGICMPFQQVTCGLRPEYVTPCKCLCLYQFTFLNITNVANYGKARGQYPCVFLKMT